MPFCPDKYVLSWENLQARFFGNYFEINENSVLCLFAFALFWCGAGEKRLRGRENGRKRERDFVFYF